MKDYYKILGLEKGASKDEIKKAFRKLVAKYHPDKAEGNEEKYKEITEAYAVLSDDKKRAEYDAYGHSFPGSGGAGGGFNWQDFQSGFSGQGFQFDISDIFENFGFGSSSEIKRGQDIAIDVNLTFSESIFGTTRKIFLKKNTTCKKCQGSGAKPGSNLKKCDTCAGKGKIKESRQSMMGVFSTVRECSVCKGRGKIPEERCPDCVGSGIIRDEVEVNIKIPAGIQNGETIRMPGQGEEIGNEGEPGDLYVRVHVENDPNITRQGLDLIKTVPIKLTDAILGAIYEVETLDGSVKIKIPAGISHGELIRIKGKGVPSTTQGRGNFFIKAKVETPKKLSKHALELVKQLREEGI